MRASVLAAFPKFQERFEGALSYMYTDALGLVTTGIGNLIDPVAAAMVLPWKHADGTPASTAEIESEWHTVKAAWPSVQSTATRSITQLHLDQKDIDYLVAAKAHSNEEHMRTKLTNLDSAPADAQMGAHSMAWAMGPGFVDTFHNFAAAFNQDDFRAAAKEAGFRGTGIAPRLAADQVLFANAAAVVDAGGDRDVLYYPAAVSAAQVPAAGIAKKSFVAIALAILAAGTAAYFATRKA